MSPVFSALACSGLTPLKPKVTLLSLSLSSSAAPVLCLSSPPSLNLNDLVCFFFVLALFFFFFFFFFLPHFVFDFTDGVVVFLFSFVSVFAV